METEIVMHCAEQVASALAYIPRPLLNMNCGIETTGFKLALTVAMPDDMVVQSGATDLETKRLCINVKYIKNRHLVAADDPLHSVWTTHNVTVQTVIDGVYLDCVSNLSEGKKPIAIVGFGNRIAFKTNSNTTIIQPCAVPVPLHRIVRGISLIREPVRMNTLGLLLMVLTCLGTSVFSMTVNTLNVKGIRYSIKYQVDGLNTRKGMPKADVYVFAVGSQCIVDEKK